MARAACSALSSGKLPTAPNASAGRSSTLLRRPAEHRAQLEQPHIAHVAIQVARNHRQHSRHQRRPQHARLFAQRIAQRNHQRRLRRSQRALSRRAERAPNRLMESGRQQRAAHRRFLLRPRQRAHALAKRRQRVGEAVVSVNPRDLFDQIDLALQIQPPARQRNLPRTCRALPGSASSGC